MRDLLKWELYKIFNQKIIYVTFFLLIILSTGFTFFSESDEVKQLYEEWEGELTKEKVQDGEKLYAELLIAYPEFNLPTELDWAKAGIYEEIAFVQGRKNEVDRRMAEIEGRSTLESKLEHELLSNVDISSFYDRAGPSRSVGFYEYFSFVAVAVMVLIGVTPIYSKEFSSKTDAFILSSKNGRKKHVWAKIGAALIFTSAVAILIELWNLFYHYIQFGNEGWRMAMQTIPYFGFSPYPFTIAEYHFIQFGIHYVAALVFALFVVLVSMANSHVLMSFIISSAFFFVPYFIYTSNPPWEWLEFITLFSFPMMMRVNELFLYFNTANVFGLPIVYPLVACILLFLLSLVIIGSLLKGIKEKEIVS